MNDIRKCPKCNSESYVVETRLIKDGSGEIRRRRMCPKCLNRYSTREVFYDYRESDVDRLKREIEERLEILSRLADKKNKRKVVNNDGVGCTMP